MNTKHAFAAWVFIFDWKVAGTRHSLESGVCRVCAPKPLDGLMPFSCNIFQPTISNIRVSEKSKHVSVIGLGIGRYEYASHQYITSYYEMALGDPNMAANGIFESKCVRYAMCAHILHRKRIRCVCVSLSCVRCHDIYTIDYRKPNQNRRGVVCSVIGSSVHFVSWSLLCQSLS